MRSRAAGYVRVSDESQVEGLSLDAQRREIARYCESHGLELVQVYADEGVSARTDRIDRRPALARLLEQAADGSFELVVVHTIDRWARNVGVQRQALQRLGQAGIGFVSVTENIDFSTAAGKLLLTMLGGVSEFFSDQLAVHISKAKREQAERGIPPGPIPFGYASGEDGVPLRVSNEAEAVLEVFTRRAEGASHGETARWLNARGFRTRTGRLFTPYATKNMTNNAFYTGVVTYKGEYFAGRHEPIVPEGIFQRSQARRAQGVRTRRPRRSVGALRGLVCCANRGSAIHSELNRHGAGRYRERHGVECVTNGRTIAAKFVDEQIAAIVGSVIWKASDITAIAREATSSPRFDVETLRTQQRRLARAYADGGLTDEEYERRLADIDLRLAEADKDVVIDLEEARIAVRDFGGLWADATNEQRRRLVAPSINQVYVDLDRRRIVALDAQPEFSALVDQAATRAGAECELLPKEEGVGWWRRGRFQLRYPYTLD
ncbi:MAG: recombinase family protein [Dehalococcoidia bacterium]